MNRFITICICISRNVWENESKWIFIYTSLNAFVRIPISVKRGHDYGNSYKRKHLIGTGKYGAGEGVKSSRSWSTLNTKWSVLLGIAWAYMRAQHSPPQRHTL